MTHVWCRLQVKKLGENSDIVYLSYQGKLGVCARDLCLLRAWQMCPDGSTVLVADSVDCDDVPRVAGKVRAECHDCAYMVSQRVHGCYALMPYALMPYYACLLLTAQFSRTLCACCAVRGQGCKHPMRVIY